MITVLLSLVGLSSAKISELQKHCPTTYTNWTNVPEQDWYWESDWATELAGGNTVYPLGFRQYTLAEFNEPPICLHVPNSGDKKVEILIESESADASICIHDASDLGYSNNDVGNVATCGKGQLYSCFTAAEAGVVDAETQQNIMLEDFSFYVYCQESCEASDVNLWIRIRTSEQTWDEGKQGVDSDLEMWCEMEKGTRLIDPNTGEEYEDKYYFGYPSELIQDVPRNRPWTIIEKPWSYGSAAPNSARVGIFAAFLSVLGMFFCC